MAATVSSSNGGQKVEERNGNGIELETKSPTIAVDGCLTVLEQEDTDSAYCAELSPGASQSSSSSTSGRSKSGGGDSSARSTGTNSIHSTTTSTGQTTSTNKQQIASTLEPISIAFLQRPRDLLDDEVKSDRMMRIMFRSNQMQQNSNVEVDVEILKVPSKSLGHFLYQIATYSSEDEISASFVTKWIEEFEMEDLAKYSEGELSEEFVASAQTSLEMKHQALKWEYERVKRELAALKQQRLVLVGEKLKQQLKPIDEECFDRLESRLDELDMGAKLAVRVASRAARLSGSGNLKSNEFQQAMEKLDDVRDVVDSLRQRITAALHNRMLLTAITDSELSDLSHFVNTFAQLLFEFHEVEELVAISSQQIDTFKQIQTSNQQLQQTFNNSTDTNNTSSSSNTSSATVVVVN